MSPMEISFSEVTSTVPAMRLGPLYLIPVVCDDTQAPLVFDTGASITTLSRTTAEKLHGIKTRKTLTVGGNAASRIKVETMLIPQLSVGGAVIRNLSVAVVEDEMLDFGFDETGTHFLVQGLLGWDIIQLFTWRFNAQACTFNICKPAANQVTPNMEDWDNMPLVHVQVDNRDEVFGFDSGNTETMLGDVFFERLTNAPETSDSFSGVDGVKEERIRIAETLHLQVGKVSITLQGVPAVNRKLFPCRFPQVGGLLAADILQGRSWIVDYPHRYVGIFKD